LDQQCHSLKITATRAGTILIDDDLSSRLGEANGISKQQRDKKQQPKRERDSHGSNEENEAQTMSLSRRDP
jgi:hypothetical protein